MSELSQRVPAPMHASDRRTRIWRVVASIPVAYVASYGQVAALAGLPRAARQVAPALREAPDHLALPWHRVLSSTGKIAFAVGTSSFEQQVALLRAEGVLVQAGRVNMRRYRWSVSLDELLWCLP